MSQNPPYDPTAAPGDETMPLSGVAAGRPADPPPAAAAVPTADAQPEVPAAFAADTTPPPPPPPPAAPAVSGTPGHGWRYRAFRWRSMIAIGAAGVLLGATGGASITYLVADHGGSDGARSGVEGPGQGGQGDTDDGQQPDQRGDMPGGPPANGVPPGTIPEQGRSEDQDDDSESS